MNTQEQNNALVESALAKCEHPRVARHREAGYCCATHGNGTFRQRSQLCKNKATHGKFCARHAPND